MYNFFTILFSLFFKNKHKHDFFFFSQNNLLIVWMVNNILIIFFNSTNILPLKPHSSDKGGKVNDMSRLKSSE